MLPKNSKHYILPTAEQLDMDPQLVEDVVSFYYAELRKALSNLVSPTVQVEGLGTFSASYNKLRSMAAKYLKGLELATSSNRLKYKADLEAKMANIRNIQTKMFEERQRKKEFKAKKDEQNRKDLDESKTDPGRIG